MGSRALSRFAHGVVWLCSAACSGNGQRVSGNVVLVQCDLDRTQAIAQLDVCSAAAAALEQDPTTQTCTHAPLAGAWITVQHNNGQSAAYSAVSDGNGHFALSAHEVTADTRIVITAHNTVEKTQAFALGDAGLADVIFTPAGSLSGRVTLPSASADVNVDVDVNADPSGIRVTLRNPNRTAVTDNTGRFVLHDVPTGPRALNAVSEHWTTDSSQCVIVQRGQTTHVTLPVVAAPPVELPANTPPTITGAMSISIAAPDPNVPTLIIPPPGAENAVTRGQTLTLTCHAGDTNNDPLNYAWFASGGTLETHNDANASLWVDDGQDVAIQCSVFDSRGGMATDTAAIAVYDPFYAGADLFWGDDTATAPRVILATAYGTQFDLVVWTPNEQSAIALEGDQWLPYARGDRVAYVDQAQGPSTLVRGQIAPTVTTDPTTHQTQRTLLTTHVISDDAQAYALTQYGVVWIDIHNVAWLQREDTAQAIRLGTSVTYPHVAITTYPAGTTNEAIALSTGSSTVTLFDTTGATLTSITTPSRGNTPFSVRHGNVAYWLNGTPYLITPTASIALSSDAVSGSGQILIEQSQANTANHSNRIRVAYSYYGSPLKFIEPTVVTVESDAVTDQERIAVGAKQVMAFDKGRVLVGQPRGAEDTPSYQLWLYDLTTLTSD